MYKYGFGWLYRDFFVHVAILLTTYSICPTSGLFFVNIVICIWPNAVQQEGTLGYCISVWCKNRISYESTQLRTNLSSSSRQECWLSATPPYTAPVSWLSLRSFLASVPNVVMSNSWVMLMLSNIHPNNRCVEVRMWRLNLILALIDTFVYPWVCV